MDNKKYSTSEKKNILMRFVFQSQKKKNWSHTAVRCNHDDVIKRKHFLPYWPVTSEFPAQRPVTRRFDVFFDLRLTKWLSKQQWGWWIEMSSCPSWRHHNDVDDIYQQLTPCEINMVDRFNRGHFTSHTQCISNEKKIETYLTIKSHYTNNEFQMCLNFKCVFLSTDKALYWC